MIVTKCLGASSCQLRSECLTLHFYIFTHLGIVLFLFTCLSIFRNFFLILSVISLGLVLE